MAGEVPNKILYNDQVLLDLTGDTATAEDVASGKTFHLASGVQAVGAASSGGSKCSFYGTSSTAAATAIKVVSCEDWILESGNIIGIYFSTANTAATPRLNINGTGAKPIEIGSSSPTSSTNVLKWSASTMVFVMYDGSSYRYITSVSAASLIPSRGANTWYGTSDTAEATSAKVSAITNYVLTKGAVVYITFTTGNTANAPTLNINSTGAKPIYYNNAVTSATNKLTWSAGETLTFVYSGSYYYFVGRSKDAVSANGVSF